MGGTPTPFESFPHLARQVLIQFRVPKFISGATKFDFEDRKSASGSKHFISDVEIKLRAADIHFGDRKSGLGANNSISGIEILFRAASIVYRPSKFCF